jgi:peptidoglycan/LPS O-acetylase OafA/YrhL
MKGWQFGIVGGAKYWMPHYNPWGFFGHYALGVLAAGANTAWQRRRAAAAEKGGNPGSLAAEILVWGGAAAMAALLWVCRQAPDFSVSVGSQPYYFPWFPLAATVALAGLPQSRWDWKVWDNPVGCFIARISFGLYIWHYLIMELLSLAWWPDYRRDFGIADPLKWGGITALAFGTTTLVAWLSWTFLEKPLLGSLRFQQESG